MTACAKFGLEYKEDIKIVLEEDGTEIDNDYLPFVKPNTVLMMLKGAEVWSDEKSKYIILRFSSQLSSTELFIFVSETFTFVVYNVVLVIVLYKDMYRRLI